MRWRSSWIIKLVMLQASDGTGALRDLLLLEVPVGVAAIQKLDRNYHSTCYHLPHFLNFDRHCEYPWRIFILPDFNFTVQGSILFDYHMTPLSTDTQNYVHRISEKMFSVISQSVKNIYLKERASWRWNCLGGADLYPVLVLCPTTWWRHHVSRSRLSLQQLKFQNFFSYNCILCQW